MDLDLILATPTTGPTTPPPVDPGIPLLPHYSSLDFDLSLDVKVPGFWVSSLGFGVDLNLYLGAPPVNRAGSLNMVLDLDVAVASVRNGIQVISQTPLVSKLDFSTFAFAVASTPVEHLSSLAFDLALDVALSSPRQVDSSGIGVYNTSVLFDLALDLTATGRANSAQTNPAAGTGGAAQGIGTDRTGIELTLTGSYSLEQVAGIAFGLAANVPRLTPRALQGVSVQVPSPVILAGQPCLPAFVLRATSSLNLKGHSKTTDTDPVTGTWTHRWLASDLALTGEYMDSWPAHGAGPAFNSVYPYRPKLRAHQVYGAGAKRHTFSNMVFFNPNYVEHMWLDAGAGIPQPYTWIFVGLVLGYPSARYGHWMLDAGKATPVFAIGTDNVINDQIAKRATLSLDRKAAIISTSNHIADGNYVRTPHDYAPRPKVYVAEFNGKTSYVASMDTHSRHIQRGPVDVVANQHFVVGRRQNRVSDNFASHMALLEIRLYKRSMATAEITAIYKQLASTYRFNKF